ncbi:MAG: HAMP domain-containing protein [Bacteroidales bacterium]|nr:HAMP domain-containing protein [Bacteroidales bacterium]
MSGIRTNRYRLFHFLEHYAATIVFLLALILLGASFARPRYEVRLRRQVARVEKALHKRELLAERYAMRAINASDQDWVDFDDMPEDIVLYCYQNDTMKCWTHEFPIGNDEVDVYPFSYRLQFMSNRNLYSSPLAYIGMREKYVNLGSAWYVVTTQFSKEKRVKVITGIRIKTEYPNSGKSGEVNRHIRLKDDYTTVAINENDTGIVYGIEGEPLFSVVPVSAPTHGRGNMPLRWVALALMLAAVFPYHIRHHTWRSFWFTVGTLAAVRVLSHIFVSRGFVSGEIFSPVLYADTWLFNSLGGFLLNNLVLSMLFYAIFVMRYRIHRSLERVDPVWRQAFIGVTVLVTVLLGVYIHYVMRSLILNSSIVMEPYRISDISIYSMLCYVSFAMLFLALLFQIYLSVMLIRRDAKVNLFSWRYIVLYILVISLYSVIAMNVYGLQKEFESNRVNTGKLAIERDLSLEMFLREVEPSIQNDPFIAILTPVNGAELIKNRLIERYLYSDIVQKYNITISTCSATDLIKLGQQTDPVGCFSFYDNMLKDYGVAVAPGSNIYYLRDYNGLASYLGVFTFLDTSDYTLSRLFLELESKYRNDVIINPLDAITTRTNTAATLPPIYSYARYSDGRLVSHGGNYDYPVLPSEDIPSGYAMINRNGYIHFVNLISDEDLTVVSRPRRPFFPHLVSFSYLAIFYGFFLLLFTQRWRREKLFNLPKHSLKRKITLTTTLTMVAALVAMGVGSVIYVMRLNRENNRESMDAIMTSVQTSLAEPCRYAMRYNELNTPELFSAMESFTRLSRYDINLYNTHGELIRSTKPELFDQYLKGKRMNNKAYRQIVIRNQLRFVDLESVAGVKYYSIYEPVFNGDGTMVAIANVPYFQKSEDVTVATASTVSAIINIYLILLITAVALGALMSNSLSKPLVEIKQRIDRLGFSGNRRIRYRNTKDELGVLINSYNKMVEDLEESSRQLAQSEREQAWKEMARQIAHEIKNPLTPMKLSIQYLMKLKEANVPGWEDKLESVSRSLLEQIDTLSQTASEFSSFARFYSEDIVRLDLAALIGEQLELFDNREEISLDFENEVGEAWVDGRRSQLARVLVNLITNSIQAIDNAGKGTGTVRIRLSAASPAEWQVDVEDDGPGVGEADLEKLFTPNFTTKKTGTGLGLAICKSIIEQSQGTISYSRSDLGGAKFSIVLPKA